MGASGLILDVNDDVYWESSKTVFARVKDYFGWERKGNDILVYDDVGDGRFRVSRVRDGEGLISCFVSFFRNKPSDSKRAVDEINSDIGGWLR